MKKFEYKTIVVDTDFDGIVYLDQELYELGEKGWELVTAATVNCMDDDGDTYTKYIWYTLKREIE